MRTFVLIIAAVLLLAACGGRSAQQPPPAASPSPAGQAPAAQEVRVQMSEFKFQPATVEVRAGKITFELENTGTVEHNFVIVGQDKRVEAIQPGKTGELEAELAPGTYRIECDVPGHKEAGMTMTVVVK